MALLPINQAIRRIFTHLPPPSVQKVPLADSIGLVLTEEVKSDMDMPPFTKAMMDGYAVRSADVAQAPTTLKVVDTIHAGKLPKRGIAAGQAAKIMTGAPVPDGADAVVMVEQTESDSSDSVIVLHPVPPNANLAPKGQDVWNGVTVLSPGRRIGPAEIGVLAAVGQTEVQVYQPPRVAIFTTGDEVVVPQKKPGPGQIRNSNSPGLVARVQRDRGIAEDLGILPDEQELMQAAIRVALGGGFDVVILTGGVSMGEKDLVGRALAAEGFNPVFHRINLKPGKPVLFGTAKGALVFGLPGNPVSVAVTYELLVRPVLRYLMGYAPIHRPRMHAPFVGKGPVVIPREQYLPAKLMATTEGFRVKMVPWHGSADLFGFSGANALLRVPGGGPAPQDGDDAEVVVIVEELSGLLAHGRR